MNLKEVLMKRDEFSAEEADELINDAREDALRRLGDAEMPFDICKEHFGLEPDYLFELLL